MSPARRTLLPAPSAAPALAQAQTGELVVGIWGGGCAALLIGEIEQPLLRPRGLQPVHDYLARTNAATLDVWTREFKG
ncbi:hypothetical protein [Siccirubricoccus phaeus]|uniref:hypothetical protein n=1 Tax=Siccirubricoccus phaeus TaxID=2595053 RepID=UPI0011F10ED7|nr:hypothetical protein [Siccirubricoccus phaeus]